VKDRVGADREGPSGQQRHGTKRREGRKRKAEWKGREGRKETERRDGRRTGRRGGEWKGSRKLAPRVIIKVGASELHNIRSIDRRAF